ncbi:hypothetical protein [Convivina praedatoris]|uniref:Uncharacterized protein n=1 Tax=Convivina praedatoris TaxID=2880963 RepID=A0ABN8H7C5_9LACO|nr:hypothetical protein [Convivina sp. LMG 32447]CAH1850185.1 hypothetical protein R078138_00085 [Convivina sp. LMG 32447]CAH1850997.1 hypothetical protein LMG032447_00247 [Convivina sp. LMG 32447]CAH1851010.1 hypothetical protein R077815_00245 [Convivina sp. LMG 32447]
MTINYVLSPSEPVKQLLDWQAADPKHFFLLKKADGMNVLLLPGAQATANFSSPLQYQTLQLGSDLTGTFVYQIDFKYSHDNDQTIQKLLGDNAVMAGDIKGKASGVIWTFWDSQKAVNDFVTGKTFESLQSLIQEPYTIFYRRVMNMDEMDEI